MTAEEITREVQKIEAELRKVEKSLEFVAVGRVIMLGKYCVGRMKSRTYAIRTANALNAYQPDRRGR